MVYDAVSRMELYVVVVVHAHARDSRHSSTSCLSLRILDAALHVAVVENSTGVGICPCYSMPSCSFREGFRSECYCSAYRDVFDNYDKIPFAYQRRLCICMSHAQPYNQNSQ